MKKNIEEIPVKGRRRRRGGILWGQKPGRKTKYFLFSNTKVSDQQRTVNEKNGPGGQQDSAQGGGKERKWSASQNTCKEGITDKL